MALDLSVDPDRFRTLRRMVADEGNRVLVSFGGGAVPGICGNLGLALLLERLGLRDSIDEVWGTSAGAVVGGGWASGSPASKILDVVYGLNRRGSLDVQWDRLAKAMLLRPFGRELPDGLIKGQAFYDAIDAGLTARTFEDCPTTARTIAVKDDGTLQRHIFSSGPLLPAIFASMTLPGIVVPREGYAFYDGGIAEKTPLQSPIAEHLRRGTDQRLLLIGTHYDTTHTRTVAKGFLVRFLQTLYAMEEVAWNYQLQEARERQGVTLLLLNPRMKNPGGMFDFTRTEQNVQGCFEFFSDILQDAEIGYTLGAT